jgi:hypothetical protein
MLWIYNIPTWLLGILTVGVFVAFSTLGILVTRPLVRHVTGEPPNEGVDVVVGSVTLFYGLILALIAVAVWEQYTRVDETVTQEAASVRALYRDVETFPEPRRAILTQQLEKYLRDVIDKEWPAQRRGVVPTLGVADLSAFQETLANFDPKTPGQQVMDATALAQFNKTDELRNARLQGVTAGVPATLWTIILLGAVLTMVTTFFLGLDPLVKQLVMSGFVATIIALIVLMAVIVDHPFLGEYSVGPDAFELMYNGMTSSNARIH